MASFNKPTGLFEDHVGDLYMPFCRFVESGGDNLRLYAAAHVGDFLGTLVDQKDDFVNLGMVVGDRIGYRLQEHGLTGLRLGDDQTALSLSDGSEHIHDTAGYVILMAVSEKVEFLVREEGSQEVERNTVADIVRSAPVYILDPYQGEVFVTFLRGTDLTGHSISCLQCVLFDLILGNMYVIR